MPVALDDYIYCSPFLDVDSLDRLIDEATEEGSSFQIPAPLARHDEYLDEERAADILHWQVELLPERQRSVIHSVFFDGLSPAATARRLGISGPAVSKLKTKALDRLRAGLEPQRNDLFV